MRNTFEKYRVNLRKELIAHLELGQSDIEGLADVSTMYPMGAQSSEAPPTPFEFQRRYGQDLKDQKEKLKKYRQSLNRIGEINWQAINDYGQAKNPASILKRAGNRTQKIPLRS